MGLQRRGACLLLPLVLAAAVVQAAPPLELSRVESDRALVVTGELQEISAALHNPRDVPAEGLTVDLGLPPGWEADPIRIELPALAPYATHPLRFRLRPIRDSHGNGRVIVTGGPLRQPLESTFRLSSCHPLATPMVVWQSTEPAVAELPEDGTVYVATGSYILFLPKCGAGRAAGLVYQRRGNDWSRVATLPALGYILYADAGRTGEHWVAPERWWIPPADPGGEYLLTLRDEWQDDLGRGWVSKVFFAPTADPRVIKCTHLVWCSADAVVRRFEGPMACIGDGSFGGLRGEVAMPTETPEQRTDGALLARGNGTATGVMAVEPPTGGVVGLLYDPNQAWHSGQRVPHGLFASPNRLHRQQNHYLSLLVPRFAPTQPSWSRTAAEGLALRAGEPLVLRSELFVSPDGRLADVRAAWQERFGDPNGPGHRGDPLLARPTSL